MLDPYEGNPPVILMIPHTQGPVMWTFGVLFVVNLSKLWNKLSSCLYLVCCDAHVVSVSCQGWGAPTGHSDDSTHKDPVMRSFDVLLLLAPTSSGTNSRVVVPVMWCHCKDKGEGHPLVIECIPKKWGTKANLWNTFWATSFRMQDEWARWERLG